MKSEPISLEFFPDVDLTPHMERITQERRERLHAIFGPEVGERYLTDSSILKDFFGIGELWDGWQRPLHYARAWKEQNTERQPS